MLPGRTLALLVLLAPLALAQPRLTLIEDTLYKADGTRFNGSATITWNAFESTDLSNIGTQSITVTIVNGGLRVQLVPNSAANPPNPYVVRYQSDGHAQFSETWTVPASDKQLRVRDVRDTTGTGTVVGGQTPVLETDVIGLVADLGLRPVKGPAFGLGRTAIINSTGAVETVVGNLSDCVRVDGTAGPCGDASVIPAFVDGESPAGIVDGSNKSFTVATAPSPASSLAVYRNGLLQKTGFDYTLSGATIQFVAAATPQPADTLLASYRVGGAGVPGRLSLAAAAAPSPSSQPAEVVCSSMGTSTNSNALTSLGNCILPANAVQPGDRLEIRFAYAHAGVASDFVFVVRWGSTVLVQRTAGAADAMVTGRGDAGVYQGGSQLSVESWGTALPFQPAVANATDSVAAPLRIDFLAQSGADTVTLRNYTVLRYPRVSHP